MGGLGQGATLAAGSFVYGEARANGITLAPVVADNDPLPAETIATANLLCHAAGDFLMRASSLTGAMHRPIPLDRCAVALEIMQREAAAMATACERIAASIRALQAKAGETEARS